MIWIRAFLISCLFILSIPLTLGAQNLTLPETLLYLSELSTDNAAIQHTITFKHNTHFIIVEEKRYYPKLQKTCLVTIRFDIRKFGKPLLEDYEDDSTYYFYLNTSSGHINFHDECFPNENPSVESWLFAFRDRKSREKFHKALLYLKRKVEEKYPLKRDPFE